MQTFADDVGEALGQIRGMSEDRAVLDWAGLSAEAFRSEFDGVPPNLQKLQTSYDMAAQALQTYWPKLETAQGMADRALDRAIAAQADLSSAQSALSDAQDWVSRAGDEADRLEREGERENVEPPSEAEVRAATRDATAAGQAQSNAQGRVGSAEEALSAARQLALDAKEMREDAARTCASDIDAASDAGIQNRRWWEDAINWVSENWDTIVEICKVVVAVLGIVVMIIGGPLAWVVLAAALVVLADTLVKYANGEASLWDVAFAALDCIPGMKGLTTLGGLARGMRSLATTGLRGLRQGMRGLGQTIRRTGRNSDSLVCRTDPIDMATGEMVMDATDVELPGVLPLLIQRHHRTSLLEGTWFGPSWASTLDQRLVLDEAGLQFVTADGMVLDYPRPIPGLPVLPVEGPRWELSWDGAASTPMTVRQGETGLSFHFGPVSGRRGGELPLTSITDRNDNRVRLVHDESGDLTDVIHDGGYHVAVTTADRRITQLRLLGETHQQTLVRYAYDERGNLSHVHNSSDLPLTLSYDDQHRVIGWEDRNNVRYQYTYDDQGRCVATDCTGGFLSSRIVYDTDTHRTLFTDSRGNTTVYEFNDCYQLVAETDPLGNHSYRAWDRFDRLLSATDPLGLTVSYEYDEVGYLSAITRANSHGLRIDRDARGLPLQLTEADGSTWQLEYDEKGNNTAAVDAAGGRTTWAFDATGAIASVTDALGKTTRFGRSAAGLKTSETDPLGATTTYRHDPHGRVIAVTDPLGATTRAEWSPDGKLTRLVDPLGGTREWTWDGEGNCLSHTDENGGITRNEFGPFDRMTTQTLPDGARYEFTYDTELSLAQVVNPLGLAWEYEYDAAGRLVSERDFDDRALSYSLDPVGQVVSRVNASEQRTTFSYGPLGEILEKNVDGQITAFEHDVTGQLTRAVGPGGEVVYERALAGHILSETVNGRAMRYGYDSIGRIVSRTTPSGRTSHWEYDDADRVTALRVGERTFDFAYDAAGQEVRRTIGPHVSLSRDWDEAGRLIQQDLLGASGVTARRTYSYRQDHQPVRIHDGSLGTAEIALDAVGRVTSIRAAAWEEDYAYDLAGNQAAARWPGLESGENEGDRHTRSGSRITRAGQLRYEYDADGRVVLKQRKRLSRKPDTWRYTWDAEDRLTAVTTPDGTRWSYLYDPIGRRIAKLRLAVDGSVAERTDYVWFGTSVVEQSTRGAEDSGSAVITWDYNGTHPVSQTERRSTEGDLLTKEEVDERFFAIVTDLVGTPTELVDVDGNVAWRGRSTLWGIDATPDGQRTTTPLRFPGQFADEETGWYYNYHRHYDPAVARYASPDPLGLMPGPNPVAYVDNPQTACDPLGLVSCALRRMADRMQFRAGKNGVRFVSEYVSPSGVSYFGNNAKGAINFVPGGIMERMVAASGHHGHCAEIMAMARAEWAEGAAAFRVGDRTGSVETISVRSPRGDQSMHGQPVHPCPNYCQPLLNSMGIRF
ncbi:hypothetical protein GCM10022245_60790 [Streptomyces mayteni]